MNIFWSQKIKLPNEKKFNDFIQRMAYRIIQGYCRYGPPKKEQNYMTRMIMEVKAYKSTGNAEHLINIANYCHLEECEPENRRFHFDPTVDSVTRKKVL